MFDFARDCFGQSAQSPSPLPHSPSPRGQATLSASLRWPESGRPPYTPFSLSLHYTVCTAANNARRSGGGSAPLFLVVTFATKKYISTKKTKKHTYLRIFHEIKQQYLEREPVYQTAFYSLFLSPVGKYFKWNRFAVCLLSSTPLS